MKSHRLTSLRVRKFDVAFTERMFKRETKRIFRAAAVEFVQTAAANVPSLTGQAKAALINIAKSLGVNPGVNPFDPPISEYEHLQVSLWLLGNTPNRGATLGRSEIKEFTKTVSWSIQLDITAAHNGFEYFTYWDNITWHSLDQAKESALDYIRTHAREIIQVRVK